MLEKRDIEIDQEAEGKVQGFETGHDLRNVNRGKVINCLQFHNIRPCPRPYPPWRPWRLGGCSVPGFNPRPAPLRDVQAAIIRGSPDGGQPAGKCVNKRLTH